MLTCRPAVAVAFIAAGLLGGNCVPVTRPVPVIARRPPARPAQPADGVRFTLVRPEARTVAVTGSFSRWTPLRLTRDAQSGVWTLVVRLPPGEYQFKFVVDGTWVTPPDADGYVDDGFGGTNGVIVVRGDKP